MRIFLVIALAIGVSSPLSAQSSGSSSVPAEIPPASFTGKQYVDSRGCVFIRAGFGGKVTWVPRVNRKRQVLCNSKNRPSLSSSQITAAQPVVKDVATPVAAAPAVRVVRKPAAQVVRRAPRKTVVRKVAPKPTPNVQPIRIIRPTTTTRAVTQTRQVGTSFGNTEGLSVRRGPQAVHPADVARQQGSNRSLSHGTTTRRVVTGTTRQVTSVVDAVHGLPVHNRTIPADVTVQGDRQMELVWTNTVPRRLVRADTRIRRIPNQVAALETHAAPVRHTHKATGGGRYVQVGTFSVSSNATRARNRLKARGLPTRLRSSRGMTVVLAGPFSSNAASRSALSTARALGFGDAFYTR